MKHDMLVSWSEMACLGVIFGAVLFGIAVTGVAVIELVRMMP